ncbi:hypothetical protein BD324DRAFT_467240 [Kockovaella imperatae]|uniref:Transcription elongation regulator 1 n=1 Tax=Kockovaella imperatae TaxID=4999 RepID=A0A1Y1UI54_9TREE|nr:hypothetical protein BD324DRAFT_467240 [Kockovaella imperatae]ORX36775.1 hypothetical protein BD324DRAFT_467240 [Kockovaella imperatae]
MAAPNGPPGPPPGAPPSFPSNGMARPPGPPAGAPFQAQPGMGFPAYGAFPPPPPTLMPNFAPPLPPGWTEHLAPDGRTKYYYNSNTKESTYTRPTFIANGNAVASSSTAEAPKKKKKEKAKDKVSIPGTTWQRIKTNEGNVFYFEKESKRSEWTIPEEIKVEVEALEKDEQEAAAALAREKELEEERIRAEIEAEKKRIREEVEANRKRKAEETAASAKRAKTDGDDEGGERREEEEETYGPADEQDEAAWMKAVAAEFAEADAKAQEDRAEDAQHTKEEEQAAAQKVFAVPDKVNVSLEEGKALFRALLAEKDISPFTPWDQSLPLFINDPRYILLSSAKDRREVYEDYCRDVGRARRLGKATKTTESDPEKEYKALMREQVTSTRTRFDDFKRQWKRDKRFYSYGRDDREREKTFKVHLRELGERKRADAQRAETDFNELLAETDIKPDSVWSNVKKGISSDPRYDAVGSSSLREELYNTHVKKLESVPADETPEQAAERKLKARQEKAAASLKERESRVKEEQGRMAKEMDKSRAGAGREEAQRLFGSLLVDQVRDHEIPWTQAVQFLSADPRFNHPSLSSHDKQRMFGEHVTRISSKRSNALHSLFEANFPSLDTSYESVYPHIIDDPLVKRLQLSPDALEARFDEWKQSRLADARRDFDEMLGDNSFVDFWSKMRKKTLDEEAAKVKEDEMDDGEGLGEGGDADITALGRQINLEEIKSVLRRDKRYRQFDHIPEQREQWIRVSLPGMQMVGRADPPSFLYSGPS